MIIAIDLRPLTSENISGVETYIHNLLTHLFSLDKKNKYILYINSYKDFSTKLKKYKQTNVQILQTKYPNKILNLLLIFLNRPYLDLIILKKTGSKPDIFFVPDLRPTPISKKTKKITTIHDLSFHHYPNFFSLKSQLWHKLINPRKEIDSSSHIISVSDFTKRDLISTYDIDQKKIHTIHEGPNTFLTKLSLDNTDLKLPSKYFLFLSTLEPRKNLHNLIKAYNIYRSKHGNEAKLVIAGKYNSKIFANLKLDTDDDIFFTGFVNEYQKAYLLKKAIALIYPSLFEGFGLPLLEAMSFLTPIITSNTSSMPEVVKDAALLVDPQSAYDISNSMHTVQTPEIRLHLKQKMEKRIKKFSWDKCAQQTLKVFEQAQNKHSIINKFTSLFSRNP